MKKTTVLLLVFISVLLLNACSEKPNRLANLDNNAICKIQVITAMGNPAYGADSKIITDEDEIKAFVATFNNGVIGKEVEEASVAVGSASKYLFYDKNGIAAEYNFNVNNSKVIALKDGYYMVEYENGADSPCKLYQNSKSTEIVVDEEGNEMDLIRYNGDTYVKSQLPQETVEWLQQYNALTDDEKLALSYSPDLGTTFEP